MIGNHRPFYFYSYSSNFKLKLKLLRKQYTLKTKKQLKETQASNIRHKKAQLITICKPPFHGAVAILGIMSNNTIICTPLCKVI